MAKSLRLILLATFFCYLSPRAQTVSFSIQAHQDDWQLFMASRVMADLRAGTKVVFITLTAGDQSCGFCSYGDGPFFLSRENGAMYSAKFAADLAAGTAPLALPAAATVAVNGHNIIKYVYKNTVNYFLRLPDGNLDGLGFPNNQNESLQKLKAGTIPSISTIGHLDIPPMTPTETYTGWSDLTNTIKAIINIEKVPGTQSWIHSAHTNTAYNINDHSDHLHASIAAQDAVASGMTWVGVNGFMDYHSSALAPNLTAGDHEEAVILFDLEVLALTEKEYQNDFPNHIQWLPMDYFQIIKNPSGTAPFAFGETGTAPLVSELNEIPLVISVTSPAAVGKDITMSISPYEPGILITKIFDMAGKQVFNISTKVENREAMMINLEQAVKVKGTYIIKNILNDKFIETRKIVVE